MSDIILIAVLALIVSVLATVLAVFRRLSTTDSSALASRLDDFEKAQERTRQTVREEAAQGRDDVAKAAKEQRQEVTAAVKFLGDAVMERMADSVNTQRAQFESFANQLGTFAKASGERLDGVRAESATGSKQLREEVVGTLKIVSGTLTQTMSELGNLQKGQLESFSGQLGSFAKASGERLDAVRAESAAGAKQLREEVVATLKSISETMARTMTDLAQAEKGQRETFSTQIASLLNISSEKLDNMRSESSFGAKQLREEVVTALTGIAEATTKTMSEMANLQKAQLEAMALAIDRLATSNEKKLEAVRAAVETNLQSMQSDNAKQLEQMRQTVDEKLQGTLEKRLGESFKQVSERLELVHKGLGEMQTLAAGVGDLKKVLTNVKTRGTWGEVQLGALLEQVLSPDQFAANVATKDNDQRVEFAIKLPGQGADKDSILWLPIDAKFPIEDYQRLIEAQELADADAVSAAGKQLEGRVKSCASDIASKYLNPPKTTDFAILFLPIEGLFAEVVRRTGLVDAVQREYRVVVAGPTTLWAILSSLQMGFRTLAIEKRSSEVWNLLAAVKTEWAKYGAVLDGVQKKLHQASDTIEKVQARSRAVGRKLRDVEELPAGEAKTLLPLAAPGGDEPRDPPGDPTGSLPSG